MSYIKTTWTDRAVQYPRRYTKVEDGSYTTFTPAEGTVTAAGTPITAVLMNKIETGLFNSVYADTNTPMDAITTNITTSGGNVTEIQELLSGTLLRKTSLTYDSGNVSVVTTKVYAADGITVIKEFTDTISYTGGALTSVVRAIIT